MVYNKDNMDDGVIDEYLSGEVIDPCEHSQYDMEKLDEFLGNEEE